MRKSGFLPVLLLQVLYCFAQNSVDTNRVALARHMYDSQRGRELSIYTGIQYFPYSASIEGIPFLTTADWQKGTVVFDNIPYKDILMKYELVRDQLVITPSESGGLHIVLFSPRVKEFTIEGKTFIRLKKDRHGSVPEEGFYQKLADGKVMALLRTKKVIDERVETTGIYRKFVQNTRYYILKDGKYYTIRNKGDLLSVLKERRKEIQALLEKEDLNFKNEPVRSIAAAAELYNKAN